MLSTSGRVPTSHSCTPRVQAGEAPGSVVHSKSSSTLLAEPGGLFPEDTQAWPFLEEAGPAEQSPPQPRDVRSCFRDPT